MTADVTHALSDAVRRQREASDPDISAWVSANAGTGKTKVLTDRLLRLLLSGVPPERVIAITFTRAAAAEMENRLFGELVKWAALDDSSLANELEKLVGHRPENPSAAAATARRLLVKAQECPGGVRIQTIHAFCQSLLANFPLEAGLAPHFRAIDEAESEAFRAEARTGVLRASMSGAGPLTEAFRTLAGTLSVDQIGVALDAYLTKREAFLSAIRAAEGIDAYVLHIAELLGCAPDDTETAVIRRAWERVALGERAHQARDAAGDLLSGAHAKVSLIQTGEALQSWIDVADDHAARHEPWNRWRHVFFRQDGALRKRHPWSTGSARNAGSPVKPETVSFLESENRDVQRDIETLALVRTFRVSAALARLAEEERRRYETLKRERVAVDYEDLLERAGELLSRQEASDWILYKLDGGVSHILVDEAQDTAPSQWRVIAALAEEFFSGESASEDPRRTIFAVGDPKQSIYRFQGADPDAFAAKGRDFEQRIASAGLPWKTVRLELSFRSTSAVLRAVDQVWNQSQDASRGDKQTVHVAHRGRDYGRVELWPPVEPIEGDERSNAHVRRLARLMAARIGDLTKPRSGQKALYGPGDIMVLVRKRLPFMPFMVRALREAGIPVAGVDRMRLIDQPPVIDLMHLARFLLHPRDDLVLANVLRGPLAGVDHGLDEEQMFALAHGRERQSLWATVRDRADDHDAFRTVYDHLSQLIVKAGHLTPFDLFSDVLDGTQGSRSALLARLGPDAFDAIEEFLFQALEFGHRDIPSLERFTAWIEGENIEVKRDLEAAGGNVRVMTVHAAKGLEAPVVFLAEREGRPRLQAPILWHADGTAMFRLREREQPAIVGQLYQDFVEEEQREYERLLYVAMTRARDRVIVTSWQRKAPKEPGPWWSNMVRKTFAEDPAVRATIGDFSSALDSAASPAYVLEENASDGPPPPTEALESATPQEPEALPPWLLAPSVLEFPILPARRPSTDVIDEGKAVALARGTLAHQLLEFLAELPAEDRADRAPALASHLAPNLPERMRLDLCATALAVLARPEFAFMFAENSRAEVRIAGDIDGHMVLGQIDRLIVTDEEVTVIDFKTGDPPLSWNESPWGYREQMADYAALVAKAYPERRIQGMLFYIEGPVLLEADAIT